MKNDVSKLLLYIGLFFNIINYCYYVWIPKRIDRDVIILLEKNISKRKIRKVGGSTPAVGFPFSYTRIKIKPTITKYTHALCVVA